MATGFGIIGCGMISKFHSRAIADVRGAKLVACYDSRPEAADRLAEEMGCRAYHKLDDLLADKAVDVVTIGTPSGAHMEPAVAAARAGKRLLLANKEALVIAGEILMSAAAAVWDIDDMRASPAKVMGGMLQPGTGLSKVQPQPEQAARRLALGQPTSSIVTLSG